MKVTEIAKGLARNAFDTVKKGVSQTTSNGVAQPSAAADGAADTGTSPAANQIIWERDVDHYRRREILAQIYLKGAGIEIGALHTPLIVPSGVEVRYVDRLGEADLRNHYSELGDVKFAPVSIIDEASTLSTVGDNSQDFVIANHVIEHCEDPILAISNFLRVLRPDGILFLTVPEQREGADYLRPSTTLEHLIRDHEEGPEWSHKQHYQEFVELFASERYTGDVATARVQKLLDMEYSIHFHVWSQHDFLEFLTLLKKRYNLRFEVEMFFKGAGEFIALLKKSY